jgi:hypothetical protein
LAEAKDIIDRARILTSELVAGEAVERQTLVIAAYVIHMRTRMFEVERFKNISKYGRTQESQIDLDG